MVHKLFFRFKSVEVGKDSAVLITAQDARVLLNYEPFRIDLFMKDELVISVNPNSALKFEHFRKKVFYASFFDCFTDPLRIYSRFRYIKMHLLFKKFGSCGSFLRLTDIIGSFVQL